MMRMTPPTDRGYISSAWGADRSYRGGWHEGMDFHDAIGTPVRAAAAGVVSYVDNVANSYAGKWIGIDHGNGFSTVYMHNAQNLVKRGDRVRQGQQIGTVGDTGNPRIHGAAHVHFATRANASALAQYRARYGAPTTGFGRAFSQGTGVPSEPFMAGATYRPAAKAAAKAKGVKFYAGLGAIATAGLVAFIGYGVWRLTR